MKNIGFNAEECRLGLESYSAEIKELMDLVKDIGSMTSAQVEKAQTQLANLKSCLKRDAKLRDTNEGRARMSHVEAVIYAPAVQQAFADLSITANSRPNREWFNNLYDIQVTIQHALVSLGDFGK
jgi:uncharacterized ubiquitin-like protein YukD